MFRCVELTRLARGHSSAGSDGKEGRSGLVRQLEGRAGRTWVASRCLGAVPASKETFAPSDRSWNHASRTSLRRNEYVLPSSPRSAPVPWSRCSRVMVPVIVVHHDRTGPGLRAAPESHGFSRVARLKGASRLPPSGPSAKASEPVKESRTTQKPRNPQRKMRKVFLRVLRILRSTSYFFTGSSAERQPVGFRTSR